jgi:hypothetical protein
VIDRKRFWPNIPQVLPETKKVLFSNFSFWNHFFLKKSFS